MEQDPNNEMEENIEMVDEEYPSDVDIFVDDEVDDCEQTRYENVIKNCLNRVSKFLIESKQAISTNRDMRSMLKKKFSV